MEIKQNKISVIIPAYNAEKEIEACLSAVYRSKRAPDEVIVVDDASAPGRSGPIAGKFNCRVIKNEVNKGPAESRNIGAFAAKGDIIVFLDSDIIVSEDTLSKIADSFKQYPQLAGAWGIMSKRHPHTNFCSQYKNLFLHFFSMQLDQFGAHFVSAVAAVKKDIFVECGGFDTKFKTVCMEDVELGGRLGRKGYKIHLNKDAEVVHTKYYSFVKLVKNDYHKCKVFAVLLLENPENGALKTNYIMSNIPLYLSILALFFIPFYRPAGYIAIIFFAVFVALNGKFLRFLFSEKGPAFALKGLLMVIVERLIIALAFVAGAVEFIFRGSKK